MGLRFFELKGQVYIFDLGCGLSAKAPLVKLYIWSSNVDPCFKNCPHTSNGLF
jgi:hypothetical protein